MPFLSLKTRKDEVTVYLPDRSRYDGIEKEVYFMLEECEIDIYPIDVLEIARRLLYRIIPYSTLAIPERLNAMTQSPDGYSGYEMNEDTGMYEYFIYYNDFMGRQRQRWTILHEIGHIYLGHHDMDLPYNLAEAEANYFAKYSIAPYPLINITKCEDPWMISDTFDVSFEASCYIFKSFQKWKVYGPIEYVPVELQLLQLFHAA